jgi:hypothetical protein
VANPRELLLGVKQPGEINRGFRVTEKLRCGGAQRVDSREGWRHPCRGVSPDRVGKCSGTLGVDLESDRRVGSPRNPGCAGCHVAGL